MADKLIHGPCTDGKSSAKPSGSHITNGEPGFQKRTGGRFPEVVRETGSRLGKPTKK